MTTRTTYHVVYIDYDNEQSCCIYKEDHNNAGNLNYVADFDEVNQYFLTLGIAPILPKRTGTFHGPADLEQRIQRIRMEKLCQDTAQINV